MIEIKAVSNTDDVVVDTYVDADGADYVMETIAIIQSLMGKLKKDSMILHALVISYIAHHSEVLTGETKNEADEKKERIDEWLKMQCRAENR